MTDRYFTSPAMVRTIAIVGAATTLSAGSALANDSTAQLAAGGLVLTRDTHIEMKSEDLYISTREVRVAYRFRNTSPADRKVLVAFPMPDITVDGPATKLSLPTEDAENILGFTTKVDGKPVKARVEQKVFTKGKDRTAYIRSLGLPLAPHLQATRAAVDRLPKKAQQALIAQGLAFPDDFDAVSAAVGMDESVRSPMPGAYPR